MANSLNYYSAAKALDELMLELIKTGISIPEHAVDGLKSGRSLAGILLRNPGDADIAAKAAFSLENVEMNLLALAEAEIGAEYAETWQKKIIGAYKEDIAKTSPVSVSASKILSDASDASDVSENIKNIKNIKNGYWIRIQTSELTDLQEYAADKPPEVFGLSAVAQKDGYTLIYGKKEDVIAYLDCLKEIRRKLGKVGLKCDS